MEENEYKVCACCLSATNLIGVSNESFELLSLCFSIQILHKSPPFICNMCDEKIRNCDKFRCQILDSQFKLRKLYSSMVPKNDSKAPSVFLSKIEILDNNLSSDCDDNLDADDMKTQNQNNWDSEIVETKSEYDTMKMNIKKEIHKNIIVKNNSNKITKEIKKYNSHSQDNKFYNEQPTTIKKLNEDLICEVCNKNFIDFKQFKAHRATHYPNFVCQTCGQPFILKSQLTQHLKSHEVKYVSCVICKKVLKSSSLRVHLQNHSEQIKRYRCNICSKRFMTVTQRLKHFEIVHHLDSHKFRCEYCSKKFFLSNKLLQHVRRCHLKEFNVICDICGKSFYTTVECKEHMVTHTGEKKFKCDACPKSFSKRWSLTLHMRTHTGSIVKHKCTLCGKEFTQKCSLKGHMKKIHEKAASCEKI